MNGIRQKKMKILDAKVKACEKMCVVGNVLFLGDNNGTMYAYNYSSQRLKTWKLTTRPIIQVQGFENTVIATVEDKQNNIIAWNVEGFFDAHKGEPELLFSYNSINDTVYGLAIIE
jgi:hypothetical protein